MASGKQIVVASEEIARKIAANFKNTTWVADKVGGAIVTLGLATTAEQVYEWLNPPPKRKDNY